VTGWPTALWLLVWVLSLVAYVIAGRRDAMFFYAIWFGSALLWGFRISGIKPTLSVLAAMVATAVAAVCLDAWPRKPVGEAAVLLMAAVFMVMMWQVHRRQAADAERDRVSAENARLLAAQRRFLQDASHQLKTPITIALGHAELLARDLAGRGEQRDIRVVAGELARLKNLSERLLLIASSEDPEFLRLEPVALDSFIMETVRRWRPAAQRRWQVGRLDPVTVRADRERLWLALDALLENAVQHTGPGDAIRLSVLRDDVPGGVCLAVEDTGEGIARADLESIFDRFRTGSGPGTRRTGLGLALTRAIARGHGGEVRVRSAPAAGSRFEFMLPAIVPPGDVPPLVSEPAQASGSCADVNRR
jgi:signal transduction histidine kinase